MSLRRTTMAVALALVGAVGLTVYATESLARLHAGPVAMAVLAAVSAGALVFPVPGSYALLAILPLFGNHPGGRLMGVVNVPLAACLLGLTVRAYRSRQPLPGGAIWYAVAGVVVSSWLALTATLPGVWIRLAEIGSLPLALVMGANAPESDPLYSFSFAAQLLLAAAWAYALAWHAPAGFERGALRSVAAGFLAAMVAGILDRHGVFDVRDVQAWIDADDVDVLHRLAATFWNPGWFAWYFTIAFGLLLGLLPLESARSRVAIGCGLAVSYVYFLSSTQRGGFLVLHLVLAVWAAQPVLRWPRRRQVLAALAAALLLVLLVPSIARVMRPAWGVLHDDTIRLRLWKAALVMWRSAPLFGIGEGAFLWRYPEFIAAGASVETSKWGDAHNTVLQVLATRGLFGLAALSGLAAALVRAVVRGWRSAEPASATAAGLGLLAFAAYSLVQGMFYLQSIQILFFAMLVLAARSTGAPSASGPSWLTVPRVVGAVVVTVGLQIAAGRAAWVEAAAVVAQRPQGFYVPEPGPAGGSTMRWSTRRGTLCVYPWARRMTLHFADPDPELAQRPVTVTVSLDGVVRDRFELREPQATRTILLEVDELRRMPPYLRYAPFGECGRGSNPVRLTVDVSRVWSPFSASSGDYRYLGVAVAPPVFTRELLE